MNPVQFWFARNFIRCLPAVRQGVEDALHHCEEIHSCADHLPGGGSHDQPFGETYTPEDAREGVLEEADNAAGILNRLWT